MDTDQQFLEYVVKELVDNPNDVKVGRQVDEMGVLLTLDVNAADMGKIIGRSGATAKALRILLRVVGMKNNARVNLKINEPAGGRMSGQGMMGGGMAGSMGGGMNDAPMRPSHTTPEQGAASKSVDEALEDLRL